MMAITSPQCVSLVLQVDTIVFWNLVSEVRQQRDFHLSKSTLLPGSIDPVKNRKQKTSVFIIIKWIKVYQKYIQKVKVVEQNNTTSSVFIRVDLQPLNCDGNSNLTRPSVWTGNLLSKRPPPCWWLETRADDHWMQWSQSDRQMCCRKKQNKCFHLRTTLCSNPSRMCKVIM